MNAQGAKPAVVSIGVLSALLFCGCLLIALPYFLATYYLGLVVEVLVFALFAMSLDLLIGYTGMASLGHAAYFGVAAYATGLLAAKLGWSVWLVLPISMGAAAITALLFGLLALRTRGSYFLMITLALSQVVWGLAFGWRSLTGGDDGLPNIPRPSIGPYLSLVADRPFYYFVLLLVGVAAALLVAIVSSPFGYALRGIRESETRMLALGYNVKAYRLVAFVLAATFAGVAGSLYVYYTRFVSPNYIEVLRSAEVLLMVILGGAGTLIGPAIGAAIIVLLENIVSAYTERWLLVVGIIYVLVALCAPSGLIGLARELGRRKLRP